LLVIDCPTVVNTQSTLSSVTEHQQNIIEQAQELLNTIVQLGNRREIEQLRIKIKVKREIYIINTVISSRFFRE
jgi:hypothetical protein